MTYKRARGLDGPWCIEDGRILGPTKDDGWAPVIGQINHSTDVDRANGRLIVAAPELLKTCFEVNSLVASGKPIGPNERLWMLTSLLYATILATEGRGKPNERPLR